MRVLRCTPSPQAALQALRADQSETLQSMGQEGTSQALVSDKLSQALPPSLGALVMVRVRVLVELPHVAVHAVQSDQAESSQSTLGRVVVVRRFALVALSAVVGAIVVGDGAVVVVLEGVVVEEVAFELVVVVFVTVEVFVLLVLVLLFVGFVTVVVVVFVGPVVLVVLAGLVVEVVLVVLEVLVVLVSLVVDVVFVAAGMVVLVVFDDVLVLVGWSTSTCKATVC